MKKFIVLFISILFIAQAFSQNVKVATPSNPSQNMLSGVIVNSSTNLVVPGNLIVSNEFVLPKSATLNYVWTCTNANGFGTWMVSSSTNTIPGSVVLTNDSVYINAITNVTSVGSGASLRNDVSNRIFFIKSLLGSNGVSIIDGGTNLTIVGSGAGGGGTNTLRTAYLSTHTGAASYTWNTVTNITTVATTGKVLVRGQVMSISTAAALVGIRIRSATTNVSQYVTVGQPGGITSPLSGQAVIEEYLSGAPKTYTLEVFSSGAALVYTNAAAAGGQHPEITSTLGITLVESP